MELPQASIEINDLRMLLIIRRRSVEWEKQPNDAFLELEHENDENMLKQYQIFLNNGLVSIGIHRRHS
jgi:hypothetical protein